MNGRWRPGLLLAGLVLTLGLLLAPTAPSAEEPSRELPLALQGLGPPGLLWGRLTVEEESPDGPWTPVVGVEVTVYPYTPGIAAELERIRQSARDSWSRYESAVERLQELLRGYRIQVDATSRGSAPAIEAAPSAQPAATASGRSAGTGPGARPEAAKGHASGAGDPARTAPPGSAAEPKPEPAAPAPPADDGLVRRRVTDPAGLFAFDDLPSGDWLVVAIQATPYTAPADRSRSEPSRRSRGGPTFLARPSPSPAKDVDVWVTRVRVGASERVALTLTDRARWLAGPLRSSPGR